MDPDTEAREIIFADAGKWVREWWEENKQLPPGFTMNMEWIAQKLAELVEQREVARNFRPLAEELENPPPTPPCGDDPTIRFLIEDMRAASPGDLEFVDRLEHWLANDPTSGNRHVLARDVVRAFDGMKEIADKSSHWKNTDRSTLRTIRNFVLGILRVPERI